MRRWCGRSVAVAFAFVFVASCSLSSLDDLQGGTADGGDRCVEKVDCSGCQGCAKLCTCTAAPDFDQCYQSCQNEADASGGAGGAAGAGGSAATGGSSGQGGGLGDASGGSANAAGSGGSGGGIGTCDEPATEPCNICLQQQCCEELVTCSDTPACVEFLTCYSQNCQSDPTPECAMANCASSYSGADEYSALAACAQSSCSPDCGQ